MAAPARNLVDLARGSGQWLAVRLDRDRRDPGRRLPECRPDGTALDGKEHDRDESLRVAARRRRRVTGAGGGLGSAVADCSPRPRLSVELRGQPARRARSGRRRGPCARCRRRAIRRGPGSPIPETRHPAHDRRGRTGRPWSTTGRDPAIGASSTRRRRRTSTNVSMSHAGPVPAPRRRCRTWPRAAGGGSST